MTEKPAREQTVHRIHIPMPVGAVAAIDPHTGRPTIDVRRSDLPNLAKWLRLVADSIDPP